MGRKKARKRGRAGIKSGGFFGTGDSTEAGTGGTGENIGKTSVGTGPDTTGGTGEATGAKAFDGVGVLSMNQVDINETNLLAEADAALADGHRVGTDRTGRSGSAFVAAGSAGHYADASNRCVPSMGYQRRGSEGVFRSALGVSRSKFSRVGWMVPTRAGSDSSQPAAASARCVTCNTDNCHRWDRSVLFKIKSKLRRHQRRHRQRALSNAKTES
jgi:hypothetical protein